MQAPTLLPFVPSPKSLDGLESPNPSEPYAITVPYSIPPSAEKYLRIHHRRMCFHWLSDNH